MKPPWIPQDMRADYRKSFTYAARRYAKARRALLMEIGRTPPVRQLLEWLAKRVAFDAKGGG